MKRLSHLVTAVAMLASMGAAHATELSGNFNSAGYDVINFHVDTTTAVDFLFTAGYNDASIGLFNNTGSMLILNDDSAGLKPHLTDTLAAGNYSLLVTYCCTWTGAMPGYTTAGTDGYNNGSYYFSNTVTLDSMTAYLSAYPVASWTPNAPYAAYAITATNAIIGATDVPEPGSLALFGASIAALGAIRRRKQAD